MNDVKVITALDGVTATTTSNKIFVGGVKRIGLQFRRENHSSGSSTFTVNGSMEPETTTTPTMTALNMMITNTANTNVQDVIRVASVALSSNTDSLVWLDPSICLTWLSVTATEVTDGTHTAFVLLEY
jgi:hypothetical protein